MKERLPHFQYIVWLFLFIFLHTPKAACAAETTTITLGQSACLEGAFGLYGNIIQKGILARLHHINNHGGINGKKLNLISLNDDGDPRKTEDNINQLRKRGVDMFIGNMGTRNILKLLPLVETKKIAMFFPWSGDEQLRNPILTNIINGPGLLKPQLTAIVDYIEKNLKLHKIAIFNADDDFSVDAANTLTNILAARRIEPTGTASYNRFTLDIATPANTLLATDPKVVICIATSIPTAKLINLFFTKGQYGATFFGIDSTLFTGTLCKERGADFFYSSAVPNPLTSTIPLAKQYLTDLKKYFPQEIPNILSFSYYLSTAIIINAMQQTDGEITKEKIIKKIEGMKQHDIEGYAVTFDTKNRHAFGQEISIIKG